jgi:hypothetical protein
VACVFGDGVGLPLVLGHSGVDILNNIRANGGGEDARQGNVLGGWLIV